MWISILFCLSLAVCTMGQSAADFSKQDTTKPEVQNLIISFHNECRRNVNPPGSNMLKVTWSPEAAATAKKVAEKCIFAHSSPSERIITLPNGKGGECGENLYQATLDRATWNLGLGAFRDEQKDFKYNVGSINGNNVLHYTQMISYKSHKVGCHTHLCSGRPLFVCHYYPKGNVGSAGMPYKAGDSCASCPNNCDNKLCTNPCPDNNKMTNCETYGDQMCFHPDMITNCPATCNCKTEIR